MSSGARLRLPHGIELAYEDSGPRDAPCILMVSGLGQQLTDWPDSLWEGLQRRGFRTVRFDNRDCGLSSRVDGTPVNVRAEVLRQQAEALRKNGYGQYLLRVLGESVPRVR